MRNALIELQGILSSTKSYGKESLKIIKGKINLFKGSSSQKNFFFKKDNSWREEIEEFSKIIKKNLKVKTGNIFDAIESMKLVEKIYNADKRR